MTETVIPPTATASNKYPLNNVKICIDPGHGGNDPGAVGKIYDLKTKKIMYIPESGLNLQVALKLRQKLESLGAKVFMTRKDDKEVCPGENAKEELQSRVNVSEKYETDLFISVHHNASENKEKSGLEVYYYDLNRNTDTEIAGWKKTRAFNNFNKSLQKLPKKEIDFLNVLRGDPKASNPNYYKFLKYLYDLTGGNENAFLKIVKEKPLEDTYKNYKESGILAKFIYQHLKEDAGKLGQNAGGIYPSRFYVCKYNYGRPSVLLEVGYLTNTTEKSLAIRPEYQERVAESVANAIIEYLQFIGKLPSQTYETKHEVDKKINGSL